MIDAFRKDFLRSEADWQTDGQTDGRNSAGIDSALKRFLLLFFFESTRTEGNSRRRSNKEPVENLAAILLHWRTPFPAVHHYLPRWYRFPTPSFPTDISSLPFSLSLAYLFPFIFSPPVSSKLGSGLFEFSETSLISVSSFQRFPKTRVHESTRTSRIRREIENVDNNGEIDREVSYYPIIRKRIFSKLDMTTWPSVYYSR